MSSQYYDKDQVDQKLSQNLDRVEEVGKEVKLDVTKDVKAEVETFTASTTTKVNTLEGKVSQLDSKTTELNSNVAVYNQKVDNLNSAVSSETSTISIKPTDTATYLATLPNAVYRAASAGTYQFTTLPDFNVVVNKVVPEGYSVKFLKDASGWSVAVVEKLPETDLSSVVSKDEIETFVGKNKFNKNDTISGYFNTSGVLEGSATIEESVYCNFKIAINSNTKYYGKGVFKNTQNQSYSEGMRFVVFYNNNDEILESSLDGWRFNFQSPVNSHYAVITILKSNKESFQLEIGDINTSYEEYLEQIFKINDKDVIGYSFSKEESLRMFDKSENEDYTIISTNIANSDNITERLIVQSVLNNGMGISNSSSLDGWFGIWFALDANQTYIAIQGWNTIRNEIYFGKGEVPTEASAITQNWSKNSEVLIKSGNTNDLGYGLKENGKIIIPIPEETTWVGFTLKSAVEQSNDVYSKFMVNYGQSFDEYKPYPKEYKLVSKINGNNIGAKALINDAGDKFEISDFMLKGEVVEEDNKDLMTISLFVDDLQPTSLDYFFNEKKVKQTLKPFRKLSNTASQCFEFADMFIDNIQVGKTTDDGTPLRIGNYTVGANHGWAKMVYSFAANHGKSLSDVGSVWNNGTKEFVLINVPNSTTLEFTSRNDNSSTTILQLTHVSGATNTATINATSVVTNGHLFPAIKNVTKRVFLDGNEVDLNDNQILYGKEITFSESYEILEKNSMIENLISKVGTITTTPTSFEGQSVVQVNNSYVFDMNLGCTQYQDVIGLKDNTPLQDLMFLQAQFNNVDSPIRYYIPNTKPISFNGVNYDFTESVNMSNFVFNSTSDNLNFTPEFINENGVYADRVIRLHNSIGVAFGFVQTRSASKDVRRDLANRKALQIRGTKKIYMSLVDSANITMINKGDYYSAISYRKYFEKDPNRIAYYIVDTIEGSYLYADYSELTIDRLMLPAHLVGKQFEIVDKSEMIDVLSDYATDGVTVAVNSKGYLILRFKK